ncbi:hypothetical protein [Aequorivita echinoideorum]|uniref:Uncharacterized protein n=1 Tax=Aequorivita echinoideorum TaxID=1549647 RepID=A0ABS5S5M0_9FLAO|nr:hypothetical protein [Aequorivita echinoideorum]MBT0607662.1 hypothetical protein [Aequorivita echinoideorum]
MAGFQPPSLSLNYLPFSGNIPNEEVLLLPEFVPWSQVQIIGKPDWLDVIFIDYAYDEEDEDQIIGLRYTIAIKPQAANQLPVGYHTGNITLRVKRPFVFQDRNYILPVTLRILQYVQLAISPVIWQVNYTQGNTPPSGNFFQVSASRPWSITSNQTYLTFSQTNGVGTAQVAAYVDVNAVPLGTHIAQFLVDDGANTVTGTVVIKIFGDGPNDYVVVNPAGLEFSETYHLNPTDVRTFTVDSSVDNVVSTNVGWLEFSETDLDAGFSTVSVRTINTQTLDLGAYPATISISNPETGTRTIDVILLIVAKQLPGLVNGGFYYSEDRNKLSMNNSAANQQATLAIKATGKFGIKNYVKRVPYYQNLMQSVIGLETKILLTQELIPVLNSSIFYVPIKPVRYDIRLNNVAILGLNNLAQTISSGNQFQNLRFINGRNPVNGKAEKAFFTRLTYLPEKIEVAADGWLAISMRYIGAVSNFKANLIVGNNVAEPIPTIWPVNLSNTEIYTALIKVSELNAVPGNRYLLEFEKMKTEIQIKHSQMPTTQIIWENEWDCPEIFNCTGPLEITNDDGSTTTTLTREGQDYEKTIEIKRPKSFSINTGNIYQAERDFLGTIMHAKRIWIQIGKDRFEVIRNFRNVDIFKTREFVTDFTLKFKAAVQ